MRLGSRNCLPMEANGLNGLLAKYTRRGRARSQKRDRTGPLCPACNSAFSKVTDTRQAGIELRRRRECGNCHQRFTTREMIVAYEIIDYQI